MDSFDKEIPFQKADELRWEHLLPSMNGWTTWSADYYIPGEPTIPLTKAKEFLQQDLAIPALDELFHTFCLTGKKSGSNIDALHKQILGGREIVPVEDTRLHLVCQESRLFVKPIPPCLLSHEFWTFFLTSTKPDTPEHACRDVALGFMRSYAFLIQHRADLELAKKHCLIFPSMHDLDWHKWSKFIAGFRDVTDEHVAKRYQYGQLRLSRLHWAVHLFRRNSEVPSWLYGQSDCSVTPYLRASIFPLAFLFASVSIILAALQVLLAIPGNSLLSVAVDPGAVQRVAWRFSTSMLVLSTTSLFFLGVVPLVLIVFRLRHALESDGAR